MGLDYGDKTIGVAISDKLELTAQSKGVIRRKGHSEDLEKLKKYVKDYQVEEIVVGLPANMDGTHGKRVEKTKHFVNFLKKNLDLPILLWDERLSTMEAERLLIKADLSRNRRKGVIDQVAASIILQGYLDYKNKKKRRI